MLRWCALQKGIAIDQMPEELKSEAATKIKKIAKMIAAMGVIIILGSLLAIVVTGGFQHFAQVARDAFHTPTAIWIVVAIGGGGFIVGSALGSIVGCAVGEKSPRKLPLSFMMVRLGDNGEGTDL